jgi:hypothetical protein
MKKFVILLLVLGLASMSSATITGLNSVTDGIVTWSIASEKLVGHGDSLGTYDGAVYPEDNLTPTSGTGGGTSGNINGLYPAAGDNGNVTYDSVYDGWNTYAQDLDGDLDPDQAVGDWFSFDVSLDGAQLLIDIWSSNNSWGSAIGTITVVPEPMTIALLGLGGLFLRRRK